MVEEIYFPESLIDESPIADELNSHQLVIDPIVEQIHRLRRERSAKHGHDLKKMVEELRGL
jgi:hypothetical protein